MGKLSRVMHEVMGIRQHTNTAWRPQATGLVERFNGTLKAMIREYALEVGRRWADGLGAHLFAYNTTVHEATGYTPYFLMHGREAYMPYDRLMQRDQDRLPRTVETYCQDMVMALTVARGEARRRMQDRVQDRDWDMPPVQMTVQVPRYTAGQQVLLLQPRLAKDATNRFATPLWTGPYEVKRRVSDLMYILDKGGKMDQVHVDRLRLYRQRGQDAPHESYDQMVTRERQRREEAEREEQGVDAQGSGR